MKKKKKKSYKSNYDPFGSYTGVDISESYSKPIQDVDDL